MLFGAPPESGAPPYSQKSFHPECTVRTTFGELRELDVIDYWTDPLAVVCLHISNDGRTYLRVQHGPGQQFALAPDSEVVWRKPREGE
jgi:hypothetical protein